MVSELEVRETKIDINNPLYLHPSEGSNSINVEKLEGISNYRSWKRSLEICLASKRKLGFVTGLVKKDSKDAVKAEAWETCNNMEISWILASVSDPIWKSIMYVHNAADMWKQLKQRFTVTNGARKYRLNKALYETKQNGRMIADYYTELKSLWEEIENLRDLPPITQLNPEITEHLNVRRKDEEEQRLFQFLNGLDDDYGSQRSHILMMTSLPTVESACSIIQQEENQREVLKQVKEESEGFAMYGKKQDVCGKRGHEAETCWFVKGFPPKGQRTQRQMKGKEKETGQKGGYGKQGRGNSRWNKGSQGEKRMAANAANISGNEEGSGSVHITAQQLEKILKLLPMPSQGGDEESNEDMEGYSLGETKVCEGLTLKNVMYMPSFKHNLLSVQKLTDEQRCEVVFHSQFCLIYEDESEKVRGVGKAKKGVYFLINKGVDTS
ncbi:Retrovirus-related Pol polyprotein from transposon TNT 1-94 [Bienertia sinuspersici]